MKEKHNNKLTEFLYHILIEIPYKSTRPVTGIVWKLQVNLLVDWLEMRSSSNCLVYFKLYVYYKKEPSVTFPSVPIKSLMR